MYARVDARDLEPDALAVGEIEKLGAATLTKIRDWVGHHQVVIQPVLNMARRDAVDSHDPPRGCATSSYLRDGHCIFPRCQVDARSCDLDHTIPYDENGPPGQTRAANLACLCRRHHRAKTTGRWRYLRTPDGDYQWHGPYGTTLPRHAPGHIAAPTSARCGMSVRADTASRRSDSPAWCGRREIALRKATSRRRQPSRSRSGRDSR